MPRNLEPKIDTNELFLFKKIYSLLDLTSLNETDDLTKIKALYTKAFVLNTHVAAVCIYPGFVEEVALALQGRAVNIATVVNFPSGDEPLDHVLLTIENAIKKGAHEIDVVFPYSRYLAGEKKVVAGFIHACRLACKNHLLKVILETGALQDRDTIAEASELAIAAGANFLKTSTGKIAVGATLEAAEVMLSVIKTQSRSVGLKISGGVRTIAQAIEYIALAESIMGKDWVMPLHFRIGASQLADVLIEKMNI